jgi:acyl-homoserine lactone acylase PvdQ
MKKILFLLLLSVPAVAQKFTREEISRWQAQARQVTIIRDTWGIPHVYGKTDADAVFGFLYAQCEDDFERVEMNYITATARLAEVEGEAKLYHDLRTRLFYDTLQAISIYEESPAWLKRLCNGFADGINYYLHTHPEVKPKLLIRFQPWMPFLFSEGSIGGDLESISVNRIKDFYGTGHVESAQEEVDHNDEAPEPEPRGSNGFAIAPSRSANGNALLLINPHTSFYFRPEVHVNSEEGLNAYGAVTWGQFFVYQGFNEHCGWMHTTSQADVMDEYLETIVKRSDSLFYQHGNSLKPITSKRIKIAYKDGNKKSYKEFTARYTHHGAVIAKQGEQWVSISFMIEPLKALTQSYQRTKAQGLEDYKKTMELKANSSNNTVFADSKGNIAYWHGNFIPKRNVIYDWTKPLNGSDPGTDWQGLHDVSEIVHSYNPASGWLQNCNSTPFTVAGKDSPDKNNYPSYMAPDAQNARGINAERVLQRESLFTLNKLIAVANDPYLAGFEELIPSLVSAYKSSTDRQLVSKLREPIALLEGWNKSYGVKSVPTTLAIYWGQELRQQIFSRIPAGTDQLSIIHFMIESSGEEKLNALEKILDELQQEFGTWVVGWGEVNRFQRLTGNINETYNDLKPSLPVGSTSSFWGSLASFGSRKFPGTNKMYGYVGNSFVAVVEFAKDGVKAKSVLAGGNSNNPLSPHFKDQAELYSQGKFKEVWFYKKDVVKHAERTYHPGKK